MISIFTRIFNFLFNNFATSSGYYDLNKSRYTDRKIKYKALYKTWKTLIETTMQKRRYHTEFFQMADRLISENNINSSKIPIEIFYEIYEMIVKTNYKERANRKNNQGAIVATTCFAAACCSNKFIEYETYRELYFFFKNEFFKNENLSI